MWGKHAFVSVKFVVLTLHNAKTCFNCLFIFWVVFDGYHKKRKKKKDAFKMPIGLFEKQNFNSNEHSKEKNTPKQSRK